MYNVVSNGQIDSDNPLAVREHSFTDVDNSSQTPLIADAVFTGEWTEILQFSVVLVTVLSDIASATDGLCVEWSDDGITKRGDDVFTIPANTDKTFSFQPVRRYLRVVYTNGSTGQSLFNLETQLKADYVKPSSHRIGDEISGEDDSELVKAAITGEDKNGDWHNVKVTEDGDLSISDNSDGLAIAEGKVTGKSRINKFGYASDFNEADGFVTIWDGAEDGEPYEAMNMTYSTTADIDYLVAQDNGDTQEIEVQGLDANFDLVVQTKTLTGQTPVALDTVLIRVFRMKNNSSTDCANHVFCYVSAGTTVTGGIPQDGGKVRAIIHGNENQTEMATFTIPNGKTGYMRSWYASTAGAKKDSNHTIKILAREFGGVFQLKQRRNFNSEKGLDPQPYDTPPSYPAKTDIEMQADTDRDGVGLSAGFNVVLSDN